MNYVSYELYHIHNEKPTFLNMCHFLVKIKIKIWYNICKSRFLFFSGTNYMSLYWIYKYVFGLTRLLTSRTKYVVCGTRMSAYTSSLDGSSWHSMSKTVSTTASIWALSKALSPINPVNQSIKSQCLLNLSIHINKPLH